MLHFLFKFNIILLCNRFLSRLQMPHSVFKIHIAYYYATNFCQHFKIFPSVSKLNRLYRPNVSHVYNLYMQQIKRTAQSRKAGFNAPDCGPVDLMDWTVNRGPIMHRISMNLLTPLTFQREAVAALGCLIRGGKHFSVERQTFVSRAPSFTHSTNRKLS